MNSILESLEGPVFSVLRPYITPYTANLPPAVSEPLVTLLTPSCYGHLIRDFSPAGHPACVQLAVSKALGLAIVGMSMILKVPQLIKLVSSRSSRGLSFLSYFLETAAYLCSLAYNFRSGHPFSTYGETAMIAVQNVLIAALILQYSGRGWSAAAWIALVAAAGYTLFTEGVLATEVLVYLQAASIPLGLASKVPQIVAVARTGGTGQLSAFAVFNYLLGSLARVFTTIQEVNDPLILSSFIGGAALNAILAAQMMWYWSSPTSSLTTRSSGPYKKKPATPKKLPQGTPKKPIPAKGKKGGADVKKRAGTPAN